MLASEDVREARPNAKQFDAWEKLTGYRPQGETVLDLVWDQLTRGSDPANLDRCTDPDADMVIDLDASASTPLPGIPEPGGFDWRTSAGSIAGNGRTAQLTLPRGLKAPTAARVCRMISSSIRMRFSSGPPHWSARWFERGERNWLLR